MKLRNATDSVVVIPEQGLAVGVGAVVLLPDDIGQRLVEAGQLVQVRASRRAGGVKPGGADTPGTGEGQGEGQGKGQER